MKTKLLTMKDKINIEMIKQAATLLQNGEVVAFPTETVYRLSADATNEQAVEKIFVAKGRPSDNPLIVHVASKEQLKELVLPYPPYVEKLINTFSPGPITYVLQSGGKVAPNVTANLSTVGVRIPSNDLALELLKQCNIPIAAPSANVSGKPSPTTAEHVLDDLDGKISAILDGGKSAVGVESTVIDCTGRIPLILRLGKITKDEIEHVVGDVHVISHEDNIKKPKSPGLKYKHYAPDVPLILVMDNKKIQQIIKDETAKGYKVGALVSSKTAETIKADQVIPLGKDEDRKS